MGWKEHNKELEEKHVATIPFSAYLTSGHFVQATFENWESEFLQMGLYVLLTISLRQMGSSESRKIEGEEEVDREPEAKPGAPWPVRKGGFVLTLYKNSLSLAFLGLFLFCFIFHAIGSLKAYNEEQVISGKPVETMGRYLLDTRFWFESFQNWQSEFLAVAAIVLLSIYLRQKGSPQSKPVDAPHNETGG